MVKTCFCQKDSLRSLSGNLININCVSCMRIMRFTTFSILNSAVLILAHLCLVSGQEVPGRSTGQNGYKGLTAGYSYGLSGDDFYENPSSIKSTINGFGFSEAVSDDLHVSSTLWQHYVISHTARLEYSFPSFIRDMQVHFGGLFRRESAERYAEVFYKPPYVFSGMDVTGHGGGLYAGIGHYPQIGRFRILTKLSLAYFNFTREYLYYFYLDPQQAGFPVEYSQREKTFASGPAAMIRAGVSYQLGTFKIAPLMHYLMMWDKKNNYGGIGIGAEVTFVY